VSPTWGIDASVGGTEWVSRPRRRESARRDSRRPLQMLIHLGFCINCIVVLCSAADSRILILFFTITTESCPIGQGRIRKTALSDWQERDASEIRCSVFYFGYANQGRSIPLSSDRQRGLFFESVLHVTLADRLIGQWGVTRGRAPPVRRTLSRRTPPTRTPGVLRSRTARTGLPGGRPGARPSAVRPTPRALVRTVSQRGRVKLSVKSEAC
jgi:hypothetical protein